MAKQIDQSHKVDKSDMLKYLETSSDFAFELHCMELLSNCGFKCRHGGLYTDPVTEKTRQFDLRVNRTEGNRSVRCAIECKNLKLSFPLLISCVPRLENESFHGLLRTFQSSTGNYSDAGRVRQQTLDSIYCPELPVGKSFAQVGRSTSNDEIIASDADVYDKWTQALASANDLICEAVQEVQQVQDGHSYGLILPVLAVPDDTLWTVQFDVTGKRLTDPSQVERCSYFVGREYAFEQGAECSRLRISHVEFVTLSGLETLMREVSSPGDSNRWFQCEQ